LLAGDHEYEGKCWGCSFASKRVWGGICSDESGTELMDKAKAEIKKEARFQAEAFTAESHELHLM
jgi:hypothetical protein